MSAIFKDSKHILVCASFIGLMLFILFFLISCTTCPMCPPCPQKDVVFPVMTPIGLLAIQLDKGFFSETEEGKDWITLEDFQKKKEKIRKQTDKQMLKEVNPDTSGF